MKIDGRKRKGCQNICLCKSYFLRLKAYNEIHINQLITKQKKFIKEISYLLWVICFSKLQPLFRYRMGYNYQDNIKFFWDDVN